MTGTIDTGRAGRLRRGALWAIAALIGAMLADLAETLVDPANTGEAAKFYAAATHHHGRMVASAVLLVVSALLLVPGVLGITRTLRDRGRGLGLAAAVFALLGGAGHVALAAFYLVFAAIPGSPLSAARELALLDHVVNSTEVKLLAPLAIAFPLALIATMLAAVRAGLLARRVLVLVAAAPVAAIVGPGSSAVKTCLALGLFVVAAAALARAVAGPARSAAAPAPALA